MDKSKAVTILNRQLKIVEELLVHRSDFRKWKRDTQIAIGNIFGSEATHINDFENIS